MTVKEREKSGYGRIVLLALGLGLLIQLSLGFSAWRRDTRRTRELLEELGTETVSAAEAELESRSLAGRAAERRLTAMPRARRQDQAAEDESLLLLVNGENHLPADYAPQLEIVARLDGREYSLDRRCAGAFLEMTEACRLAGGKPYICSGYRSFAQQQALYGNKIQRLLQEGVPWAEAPAAAAKTVARPGTSEHELGLAADIMDQDYPYLDEGQEETFTQKWLMENSWRYGFILRYPNGTAEITGIGYEPWHYRYVGRRWAEEIHRMGLTLEEYLQCREGRY